LRINVCVLLLATGFSAQAQQPKKIPRVGVLVPGRPPTRPALEGFKQGLRDLGYVENQNVVLALRWNDNENVESWAEAAREVVGLKPDVILADNIGASLGANSATETIPVVMGAVGADPVDAGLVASLARPGGNVTGLTFFGTQLDSKRLELLTESIPGTKLVAVLWNPSAQRGASRLKEIQTTAQSVGVQLKVGEAILMARLRL
jgi:putative ABC transport system substrate-binding protein